jgi:peptide/nickel transport system substrate-binding protein
MKAVHLIHGSLLVRILLVVPALFLTLFAGAASAASEPGTVTIVIAGEPASLDPCDNTRAVVGQVIMRNIVEALAEMNPADNTMAPRLATSWKQIDPTTWQFFLRKGVKFHDGTNFNAEAVIFSIKRLYDKRITSQTRTSFFSNFTMEGKALDSYTLEIKTDKPQPLLPTLMGTVAICSPNTAMGKMIRDPVGTGPYKFVKWDAGTQIIMERFDGYWGKQPQVKKGIYLWRNESPVRAAMVAIGEADLTPEIAAQDANRPDLDQSYLNAETTTLRIGGVWEPPLTDRRVRMALNLAIDRNAIRGSILSKDVVPATQMIGPSVSGYNPDLKVWPYDPKRARQLLDEARKDGVPVDKEILLVGRIGVYPGCEELMEIVMTMYKAVGFNVKLKIFEAAVHRAYDNKPYPTNIGPYLVQNQHDNNKGDAVFTVFNYHHCDGLQSHICDKQVNELIEKAQVATGEERRNLWRAAIKRINEEIIPEVMLFHMVAYARIGKRINFKLSPANNSEIQLAQITFRE